MARVSQLLSRLKRDPIADLPIADQVNQVMETSGMEWRQRLLPPLVTLRLFRIQLLHGNCPIAALRQLSGLEFAVSSYCEARIRLPLQLLESLLAWVNEQAQQTLGEVPRLARRILIADGSTYSMPDTPESLRTLIWRPEPGRASVIRWESSWGCWMRPPACS